MPRQLTPADFKFQLLEHAHFLRGHAIARGHGYDLDPKSTLWLIREEAWREFLMSPEFLMHAQHGKDGRVEKKLLGLPVRLSFEDDPDTPMVQLLMEPLLEARPR